MPQNAADLGTGLVCLYFAVAFGLVDLVKGGKLGEPY